MRLVGNAVMVRMQNRGTMIFVDRGIETTNRHHERTDVQTADSTELTVKICDDSL